MRTIDLEVQGTTCGGCTGSVQREFNKLKGVSHVEVKLQPDIATVVADPARMTPAQIESVIARLGYTAKVRPVERDEKGRS
ncbi:MAG: heavy-metal-associated domain-containing protein [Burkholderiaceae bacterium]|nr:heavy-metal-associated domain-containing protein [Burkholderiaceae bacterium]